MIVTNHCILCGSKISSSGGVKCDDCLELYDIISEIFQDARNQLSTDPSVERGLAFNMIRELAFAIQEDSLLKTYKNSVSFFLRTFVDQKKTEVGLSEFNKFIKSRLNILKILKEFSDSEIIEWKQSDITLSSNPKLFPGKVIENLKVYYGRTTVPDRSEQRFGHTIAFYSTLRLMIEYGKSNSREEIKVLNIVPRKPWLILLAILVGNKDGHVSMNRTNKFLRSRRGVSNVYNTILMNLNSLSPDFTQKVVEDRKEVDDDAVYLISPDIVNYLDRIRVVLIKRTMSD
jgi:hypothetical protein